MNFARVVVVVTLVVCVFGCGAKYVAQNRLDETLTWYQSMVEKSDLEATALVASDSIAREYQEKIRAAKDVKVVECRVLRVDYNAAGDEAEVVIEIEYYSLGTLKVKKARQTQKWVYAKDTQSARWKLMTVPTFFN